MRKETVKDAAPPPAFELGDEPPPPPPTMRSVMVHPPGGATYDPALASGMLTLVEKESCAAHRVTDGVGERLIVEVLDADAPGESVGVPEAVMEGVGVFDGVGVGEGVGGMHDVMVANPVAPEPPPEPPGLSAKVLVDAGNA